MNALNYNGEVSIRYEEVSMEDADAFFSAVADGDYDKMVSMLDEGRANVNGSRRVVEKTPHRCVLVVVIEDHASSTIGAAESIVARARSFSIMIIHSQNNTCTDPRENP